MAITPDIIDDKSFKTQLRGYSMEEVDEFLDYLKEEIEALLQERDNQKNQIEQLVKKVQEGPGESTGDPTEADNLRRQLDAARMRISSLEKSLADAQQASDDASIDNEELRLRAEATGASAEQLEEATARIAELEAENEELRAAFKDADAEREAAVREARELAGNATIRVNAIVSDAEIKAKRSLETLQADFDETKSEYETLRREIEQARSTYAQFLQSQMRMFGLGAGNPSSEE